MRWRYVPKSALWAWISWRASAGVMALAVSADGTASTTPDFRRLMLLLMNASGLAWYSEASIWSSDTPARCVRPAMRDSESPGRTSYLSEPGSYVDEAGA